MLDFRQVGCELVRALRGRRSQRAISAKLGYRTNTLYTWEAGTAAPTAARFFRLAEVTGVGSQQVLERFFRATPARLRGAMLSQPEGVRRLLHELLGNTRITALARDSGLSRYAISRWLSGKGEPKLHELLCFVEHASLRMLDLVDALVSPERLPSLREAWRKLEAMRSAGYELPMTLAVLRALETDRYRAGPHRDGCIADMLGIDLAEERRCLASLRDAEQIAWACGRWEPRSLEMIDFRRDAGGALQLKAFWARLAAERSRERRDGLFAYHVFAVSRRDLQRIEALQRDMLREMRTIIASSEPSEAVALLNLQLFDLGS